MAAGLTPLVAVIVIGYTPPVPAAGVPDRVAVPLPLSTKVTPEGRAPVLERLAVGFPLDPTVNVPALPAVKVVLEPEVMLGASGPLLTVSVKDCAASGLIPLLAVIVKG